MKHTKGKQKIEMKKVEAYVDRTITFSKRKSGILKKMNEIVSLCNVETTFLVFSEAKKPYTFAHPSLEEAFDRFKNPLRHEPSAASANIGPLVEAYKRQRNHDLMKKYIGLVEELEMENEKVKIMKKSKKENDKETVWWNISTEGLNVEELKKRCQAFVELHVSLSDMALQRFGKDGENIFKRLCS
ncbi:hypothetical protein N665_1248s0009 [Sinapis alba]|nr:hypothetical protein N665_1248s0009 [Sinapis alba]